MQTVETLIRHQAMYYFSSELIFRGFNNVYCLFHQSRVTACIERVEDILDLKYCTDGVQQALQNEDYEKVGTQLVLTCSITCIYLKPRCLCPQL